VSLRIILVKELSKVTLVNEIALNKKKIYLVKSPRVNNISELVSHHDYISLKE
jgi:hypothetical protein